MTALPVAYFTQYTFLEVIMSCRNSRLRSFVYNADEEFIVGKQCSAS